MEASDTERAAFSPVRLVAAFRGRRLPVEAHLAGYSAIIDAFDLPVPLHHEMFAVAPRNMRIKEDGWSVFHASMRPEHDVVSHLVFKCTPEEIVFPISHVILDDLVRYRDVLERTSSDLLPFIPWRPTPKGDVEVTSETADRHTASARSPLHPLIPAQAGIQHETSAEGRQNLPASRERDGNKRKPASGRSSCAGSPPARG